MVVKTFSGCVGALISPKRLRNSCCGIPLWLAATTALGQAPAPTAPTPAPASALAPAPALPLTRLLAERQALTQRYAAAKAQHSSLFGIGNKQSKRDLQAVVTALQGIVDKDEQIVAVLNQNTAVLSQTAAKLNQTAQQAQATATTLQNTTRDDRNLTTQRLAELEDTRLNVQERERQANGRIRSLESELLDSQKNALWRDGLIALLGATCVGLLLWRRGPNVREPARATKGASAK